jgi:CSLREA domain-containing protein
MFADPPVRRFVAALAVAALGCLVAWGPWTTAPLALAATFTVTDGSDTDHGSCGSSCTLRDAITAANASAGPHTIEFNVAGAGVGGSVLIAPFVGLPAIVQPVTIKGDSQPGIDPLPRVHLYEGGPSFDGLTFTAGSDQSVVRGLAITNFSRGVVIDGANQVVIGGTAVGARNVISGNGIAGISVGSADQTTIQGNFIGTNNDGTAAVPNTVGVTVGGGSKTLIGGTAGGARNIISGNAFFGISVDSGDQTTIQGNYIGLNNDGTAALPNIYGVGVGGGSGASETLIGGTAGGARNVISGNSAYGIAVGLADQTTIQGNFIGTNADGTAPLPNFVGVSILAGSKTLIGGTAGGARNVISGNAPYGIYVSPGDQTTIQGNFIGTNPAGTAALPNSFGVAVDGATKTLIGGGAAGARNVISGNSDTGIVVLSGDQTTIQGNFIGLDHDGTAALPNDNGVVVRAGSETLIGGSGSGEGNLIARNNSAGIAIVPDANAELRRNLYGGNGKQAIDLDQDSAVTCTGASANNGIHCPVLASANGATSLVSGTVDSGGQCPGSSCTVEVYRAGAGAGDFNHGEGVAFLGSTSNVSGQAWSLTSLLPFCPGDTLSAIATNIADGTTSEFAANLTVPGTVPAPGDVPFPPVNLQANPDSAKVTLSFTPTCQGGSAILDYTITAYLKGKPVGTITTTRTSGIIFPNLTNGQSHTFTVRARNGGGSSGESALSTPVTLGPDLALVDGVFLNTSHQPLAGFGGDNVYDTRSRGAGGSNVGNGDGPTVARGSTLSVPFRLENDGRRGDRIKFRSASSSRRLTGIAITVLGLKLNDATASIEPGGHLDGTIEVTVGPSVAVGKYVVRLLLQPNGTSPAGKADSVTLKFVVTAEP